MDKNTELLNYIYQNAQMGVDTISQLVEIAEEHDFKEQLRSQLMEYTSLKKSALQLLEKSGHEEKGIGNMAKVSAYLSISIKTLMDKSPCHISEMLIQGSTMGIIDATKNMQKYKDADHEILRLAEKLLKTEQNNIEQLKQFLK